MCPVCERRQPLASSAVGKPRDLKGDLEYYEGGRIDGDGGPHPLELGFNKILPPPL